jgi:hypothetical protein
MESSVDNDLSTATYLLLRSCRNKNLGKTVGDNHVFESIPIDE